MSKYRFFRICNSKYISRKFYCLLKTVFRRLTLRKKERWHLILQTGILNSIDPNFQIIRKVFEKSKTYHLLSIEKLLKRGYKYLKSCHEVIDRA